MSNIDYFGLRRFINKTKQEGGKAKDIFEYCQQEFGYDKEYRSFSKYFSNIKVDKIPKESHFSKPTPESDDDDADLIDDVKEFERIIKLEKQVDIYELCDRLFCPPKRISELVDHLRSQGFEIAIRNNLVFLSDEVVIPDDVQQLNTLEDKEIIFGVASDLHFGSTCCQITNLNEFAIQCKKEGVKYIFVPGDVVSGHKIYPGHEYDLYALTAEEQEASIVRNLPKGFEWYAIGGNHDYSFIKKGGGHNPLKVIESKREDFHYLGFDEANVPILDGVDLKMWHPSGGVPYSISYRLQKGIEQVAYSELHNIVAGNKEVPSIRFVLCGHLHIQMQALFGSIFGCQAGCFEGRTNYLKKKGLNPNIGGYIVKVTLGKKGLIKSFSAHFHVYDEIIDDYKNFNHSVDKKEFDKSLF